MVELLFLLECYSCLIVSKYTLISGLIPNRGSGQVQPGSGDLCVNHLTLKKEEVYEGRVTSDRGLDEMDSQFFM